MSNYKAYGLPKLSFASMQIFIDALDGGMDPSTAGIINVTEHMALSRPGYEVNNADWDTSFIVTDFCGRIDEVVSVLYLPPPREAGIAVRVTADGHEPYVVPAWEMWQVSTDGTDDGDTAFGDLANAVGGRTQAMPPRPSVAPDVLRLDDGMPFVELSKERDFVQHTIALARQFKGELGHDAVRFAYALEYAVAQVAEEAAPTRNNTHEAAWLDGLREAADRFKDYVVDLSAECAAERSVASGITPIAFTGDEAASALQEAVAGLTREYWAGVHPAFNDLDTQAMLRLADDARRLHRRLVAKRADTDQEDAVDAS